MDITKNVRKEFEAGKPTRRMNTKEGAAKEALTPFVPKQTIKTIKEGQIAQFQG